MDELIKSSLSGEGISSKIHSSFKLKKNIIKDEFEIPLRYFKNRVTLLPVNLDTYFIYWEITKEFKKSFEIEDDRFIFKIYDDKNNFLTQFQGNGAVGDYYLYHSFGDSKLQVVMGFQREKKFISLLESKPISTSCAKISLANREDSIWLTKKTNSREFMQSPKKPHLLNFADDFFTKRESISSMELNSR